MKRTLILFAIAAIFGAAAALAPKASCAAGYCIASACFPGGCPGDCVCLTKGVGLGTCVSID